jgi:signal transduction histidine kinase
LSRWFRPPRHVLTLFLGVTGTLSLAMAWLAWQWLAHDRALAAQRTQERLDNAAETAVTVLRRGVDEITQRLDTLSRVPPGTTPADFIVQLPLVGDDAALIVTGDRRFEVWPAGRLVYYPPSVVTRSSPDSTFAAFASGEELEFQRHDLAGALRAFDPLTRSASPHLRAGALLRIARIWSRLHQADRALDTYEQLAGLASTPAEEMPAGLVARYGRCLVLREAGRTDDLGREATALERDLGAGTWQLTKAEYEFYRAQARSWLPTSRVSVPQAALAASEQLSAAIAAIWNEWETARTTATSAGGSRLVAADGAAVLVAWRTAARRGAALGAGPGFIDARVFEPARAALIRYGARLVLDDADGRPPGGDRAIGGSAPPSTDRQAQRAAADTGLPWSIRVVDADPGAEASASQARRLVVLAGLVTLGVFVLAGGTFVVRAVNRELEVSRLQTDFVAAVSHEFRTPLTSMRQVSDALVEGRVPEPRREEYYRMQQRDGQRLQRLVESLLDFGRMESGAREYRLEPVDVTALVRALTGEFSAGVAAAGYRVETTLRSEDAWVSADREALGRAIWNLLDNAVKYSPSNKTVWLTTAITGDSVTIAVRDRGVGVPPDDQRRIFDKFARGANAAAIGAKGTGLGLAMVQHIVSAHGGRVRVESTLDEGSTFTITLPLGEPDAAHPDCRR